MAKGKSLGQLQRPKPSLSVKARYLIVCEGSATEPNYFEGWRKELRQGPVIDLKICGKECGSAPISVAEYALDEWNEDQEYDHVYCVFDRDKHESFERALDLIEAAASKNIPIKAISSHPSFEYWVLCHFVYTRHTFQVPNPGSNGDYLIRTALKAHIPAYKKASLELFSLIRSKVLVAVKNAKKAEKDFLSTGEPNPSTSIHELVELFLAEIEKSKKTAV